MLTFRIGELYNVILEGLFYIQALKSFLRFRNWKFLDLDMYLTYFFNIQFDKTINVGPICSSNPRKIIPVATGICQEIICQPFLFPQNKYK